jgi:hypothetical protein
MRDVWSEHVISASWLGPLVQDSNTQDLLPGVLAVLHANVAQLSTALQRPDMAAALAACANPDAAAALCILTMAGPTSFEDQPDFPLLMLQPAVEDCLR